MRGAEDRAKAGPGFEMSSGVCEKMKASEMSVMMCTFRERSKCWSRFEVVLSKSRFLSCIRGQLLE